MPDLTLTFPTKLNVSVSVGDTAYYVATQASADNSGFTINNGATVEIGEITSVDFKSNTIIVDTILASGIVTTSHFIFFSKNNAASMSSMLGYYSEVKMTNTSTTEAELFQVSLDVFESSGESDNA